MSVVLLGEKLRGRERPQITYRRKREGEVANVGCYALKKSCGASACVMGKLMCYGRPHVYLWRRVEGGRRVGGKKIVIFVVLNSRTNPKAAPL